LREAGEEETTSAVARAWRRWYADAENQRVFEAVNRLLADRLAYRKRFRRTKEELDADGYDVSIPIVEWRSRQAPHAMRKHHPAIAHWRRWLTGGFVVVTAAAITTLVLLWPQQFWSAASLLSGPVVYQTNVGELEHVHLRDGSSIILGGRTELSIVFSGQRRSVKLIQGQAWFKVAHDPHWPFVVAAGDGVITDVGTAFLVTRDSDRVVITVTEGTVEVTTRTPMRPPPISGQRVAPRPVLTPIRVSRGEEIAFSDNGALSPVQRTDTHAATAWTRGRLTFDDQPLRYVIETVDRYSSRHIAVSPSAGALRVSGIVFDNEIDDWLQGLQKIFQVTVEERGAGVCVHLRNSKALHNTSCTNQP
jgi:transmembrane sensor